MSDLEPIPEGELHAAPTWMSDSQREGWAYAITNSPNGLLKKLDSTAPVTLPGHPQQAGADYAQGCRELGFTPSTRSRVQVAPRLTDNPFSRNGYRNRKPWEFGADPADEFFDD